MSEELTIATGFNFAPLWEAIKYSNANLGVDYTNASARLDGSQTEALNNYLASLGNSQYKGRLTLDRFVHYAYGVVNHIQHSSQVYTLAKIDDIPPAGSSLHVNQTGRYAGSYLLGVNYSNNNGYWMKYRSIRKNATVVAAINNGTGGPVPLPFPTEQYPFTVDRAHIKYVYSGDRKLEIGIMQSSNHGYQASLKCRNLNKEPNNAVATHRDFGWMKPPEVGQEVPVREHGTEYRVKFTGAISPAGLGYGSKVGDVTSDGANYPNDETLVADGNKCDVNGGACTTSNFEGLGMTVKFIAVAGVISSIEIVDAGEGYINGETITISGNTDQLSSGDAIVNGNHYKVNSSGVGADYSNFNGPAIAILGDTWTSDANGTLNSGAGTGNASADQLEDLDSIDTPATFLYETEASSAIETDDSLILNGGTGAGYAPNIDFSTGLYASLIWVTSKTGQTVGTGAGSVFYETDGAGVITNVKIRSEPAFGESGDTLRLTNDATTLISIERWYQDYSVTSQTGFGEGMSVDLRKDDNGEVIEVRSNIFGIGYAVGDEVTIDGGDGTAGIEISETVSGLSVTNIIGVGVGMKVDLEIADPSNTHVYGFTDGSPRDIGGVVKIIIREVGVGYKNGDVLQVTGGDDNCRFGLFFLPEFETERNIINANPANAWDRHWFRHWRTAGEDDYKFRMCNSHRSVIDVVSTGLPIDNAIEPYEIEDIRIARPMSLDVNSGSYCDLNIWEGDGAQETVYDNNFDPTGLLATEVIDDLPRHARVYPLCDKDADAVKVDPDGSIEKTTRGTSETWSNTIGVPDFASVFTELTDGSDSSYARATTDEHGIQQVKKSLKEIVNDSGYIADEIIGFSITASKITDPDGEVMEAVIQRGTGGVALAQEQRVVVGDAGAFSGFWGKGSTQFGILLTEGLSPEDGEAGDVLTSMRLTMRRKSII